ncbi:MAG TPA: aldo/keto reductase [Abditibacteriaceae bacterium]|jgi:predicted dehydrogenase/aryl-alcohol dehydrogenase-like predicted oxidoreductase
MLENSTALHWGIIGTGSIAKTFARGLRDSKTGKLIGVASRSEQSAKDFGAEFGLEKCFDSYAKLLADPDVHAVYIGTPHPMHAEWAIKAAESGKHVLCEKPLTLNWPDAQRVAEAAIRNGVVLVEAFMYRCHPQTAKIVELIQNGALGEIQHIEATFSFATGADENSRWLNLELGGGGILDVGCYTASFARLVAGAAQGKAFAEPLKIKATGKLGTSGCDDYATALLSFENDLTATLLTGVKLNAGGQAKIYGTKANLNVPSPWFCNQTPNLVVEPHSGERQEIAVDSPLNLYAYEADALAALARGEKPAVPVQSSADAVGNMRLLDQWRSQIGLQYPQETPARLTVSATNEPLQVHENAMRYRPLSGIVNAKGEPKKVSQIVMGTMLEGSVEPLTHGLALFDDFFERGGTCFDTAYIYGNGWGEKTVGHWLQTRGVRDEVTILMKGAHPPNCSVEGMQRQVRESLERMQIDHADIYMMHRDNVEIPIEEWVDALNEEVRQGHFALFGGSNWSIERVQAANEYAASKGLQGFSALSNNFSLARMVNPVWSGCVSCSDAASKAWLEEHQIANFSWSSQARGFFARADKNFTTDGELVNTWYADDNFERLEHARQLAKEKGVSPVVIAAAYVLAQKFPTYALIGPRNLAETRDSMGALHVGLNDSELRWLNLEA